MELNKKIILSTVRIKTAIRDFGSDRCAVACSFGKDSMVILKLAHDIDPDIPVVWCDTKCEHPETYRFAKRIIDEWDLNIHIARAPAGVNFWTLAREYGLPRVITGITADESRQRFMLMKRNSNKAQAEGIPIDDDAGFGCGARYFGKTKNRTTLMPIIDWTTKDVWDFHRYLELPHCRLYDINGGGRLGCTPCTAYRSWQIRMPIESPKTYAKVMKMMEESE